MKKVAVIGAGAAGLGVARRLLEQTALRQFNVTVFEATSSVGGTWKYSEDVGSHSSMYRDLHTNLPKQVMGFPGFYFLSHASATDSSVVDVTYPHHTVVQEYLESFAKHAGIMEHIHFNTEVARISRAKHAASETPSEEPSLSPTSSQQWLLELHDKAKGTAREEAFDFVAICHGHYSKPYVPPIPGLETAAGNFRGRVLHSHDYRHAEEFEGQTVVCLGGGQSGRDISQELCGVASRVILSHYEPGTIDQHPLEEKPAVCEISPTGAVVFADGSYVDADAIVLCTGYEVDLSFLPAHEQYGVASLHGGRAVGGLYKHLFVLEHPSLAIVGLPAKILPFPLVDMQAQALVSIWGLPCRQLLGDTASDESHDIRACFLEGGCRSTPHPSDWWSPAYPPVPSVAHTIPDDVVHDFQLKQCRFDAELPVVEERREWLAAHVARLKRGKAPDDDDDDDDDDAIPAGMHVLGQQQWAYNDDLARLSRTEPLKAWREAMYARSHEIKAVHPWLYKQAVFSFDPVTLEWEGNEPMTLSGDKQ